MIEIYYTPHFLRLYGKLPTALQSEVKDKIDLFIEDPKHHFLRTHKLKGSMKGFWSFSVNYSIRVIFTYDSKTKVALLSVGGHSIYQ